MNDCQILAKNYQSLIQSKTIDSKIVHRGHEYLEAKDEIDIHGAYWSIGIFDLKADRIFLKQGHEYKVLSGVKILFLPPFSLLHWRIAPGHLQWDYLIVNECIDHSLLKTPLLFDQRDLNIELSDLEETPAPLFLEKIAELCFLGMPMNLSVQPCSELCKNKIDECFRESLSLKDLFLGINYSFSYLSRQFKKDFGISLVRYRNNLRMIQASVDLQFKKQSVEVIQHDLGIEDSHYFYQSFLRHLKARPSEFRQIAKRHS
jgi:AraC-like DNA-binding protein